MKGISIKGQKLHEIKMLMVPYSSNSVSYLSYPKSRIKFTIDGDEMTLSIPPKLALELFRKGVFPQDENESFPVHVSGKKVGVFKIVDFHYPNTYSGDLIKISLKRQRIIKKPDANRIESEGKTAYSDGLYRCSFNVDRE